jgi:drug/metabolite transporter (DMT)-like permease
MSTVHLLAGIGLAMAAAACFDGAVAWQAMEARRVAATGAGASLLGRLTRRPRWLAATALAAAGWPLQVAALSLAPLTVVQPVLASGLIVLLLLGARVLGEPVGLRELTGVAGIIAGVAVLASAAPERHTTTGDPVAVALALGLLAALGVIPWLRRQASGWLTTLGAGCAFACTGLTTKLMSDALANGDWPGVLGFGALTALMAVAGVADDMSAMQRLPATRVAPVVLAFEVVGPVLLAPLVVGESWSHTPGGGLWVGVGLAVVTAGVIVLATTGAVTRLGSKPSRP